MSLDYQRISKPCFVIGRLEQPSFERSASFIFPFVNGRLSERDVLELRIRVPNHTCCGFVGSNQQRWLVDSLLYLNIETRLAVPMLLRLRAGRSSRQG